MLNMETSFELLSTMSPKIKGRQKSLRIQKSSRLALKKHFRRSSIYDKSIGIRNQNLSIVEVNSSSSESLPNSRDLESRDLNEMVIIDSTDSEEEVQNGLPELKLKCLPNYTSKIPKTHMVKKWLENVEDCAKSPSFFSQVSTVYGDYSTNFDKDGNNIAASSTINDCLNQRFDELFIANGKDSKNAEKPDLSDDSFHTGINTSLTTNVMVASNTKPIKNQYDLIQNNLNMNLEDTQERYRNNAPAKAIPTTDASDLLTPVKSEKKVSAVANKSEEANVPQCLTTPPNQNIETEVKLLLDSIYGKSWRANQEQVLLPISERKGKSIRNEHIAAPLTERITKRSLKDTNLMRTKLIHRTTDVGASKKAVKSPWVERLKGLIDSDSDDADNNAKDIEKVKTRLNFENSSAKKNANSNQCEVKNVKGRTIGKEHKRKEIDPFIASKQTEHQSEEIIGKSTTVKGGKSEKIRKPTTNSSGRLTDEEYDHQIEILELTRTNKLNKQSKTHSFLESLSANVPLNNCNISARLFRTNFKQHKDELAQKLFSLFNAQVFDNAIPEDTQIEWNIKLRKTAGMCHYKKITHRTGRIVKQVKISLSTKVLDSSCRLRDTLIHEMCHAATFIINNISDGHGPYWKSWAFKAMETFPELPPIRRCHDYYINSKYTYKCTGCQYSFGRHTKSLDMDRKRCGLCMGKFEVFLNKKTKSGSTKTVPIAQRKAITGFSLFVKENYGKYKESSKTHGDVMKLLSQKFAELKVMTAK